MTAAHRSPEPHVHDHPKGQKGITPHDKTTARKIKPAILEILPAVRLALTPVESQPKWDEKAGVFRAPNGHPLFAVALEIPPPGSADMISTSAIVDPATDTFYLYSTGGIAGRTTWNGPLGLPGGLDFKSKRYTLAQVKLLEAAANPAFHASPQILSASYSGGMGIQPPDGSYAGPSVHVRVLFPNITYKPVWSVHLHEETFTLLVVIDASEGNPLSKAMSRPEDLVIQVQRPAKIGGTYHLVIEDYKHHVLHRSSFVNALPA